MIAQKERKKTPQQQTPHPQLNRKLKRNFELTWHCLAIPQILVQQVEEFDLTVQKNKNRTQYTDM